ncbi:hypothetical protein BROUX41_003588 [Berkeleyomyces rouxiae]
MTYHQRSHRPQRRDHDRDHDRDYEHGGSSRRRHHSPERHGRPLRRSHSTRARAPDYYDQVYAWDDGRRREEYGGQGGHGRAYFDGREHFDGPGYFDERGPEHHRVRDDGRYERRPEYHHSRSSRPEYHQSRPPRPEYHHARTQSYHDHDRDHHYRHQSRGRRSLDHSPPPEYEYEHTARHAGPGPGIGTGPGATKSRNTEMWQAAAKTALQAGAQAAMRLRKNKGEWMGEKGLQVGAAAVSAGLRDVFSAKSEEAARARGESGSGSGSGSAERGGPGGGEGGGGESVRSSLVQLQEVAMKAFHKVAKSR